MKCSLPVGVVAAKIFAANYIQAVGQGCERRFSPRTCYGRTPFAFAIVLANTCEFGRALSIFAMRGNVLQGVPLPATFAEGLGCFHRPATTIPFLRNVRSMTECLREEGCGVCVLG